MMGRQLSPLDPLSARGEYHLCAAGLALELQSSAVVQLRQEAQAAQVLLKAPTELRLELSVSGAAVGAAKGA